MAKVPRKVGFSEELLNSLPKIEVQAVGEGRGYRFPAGKNGVVSAFLAQQKDDALVEGELITSLADYHNEGDTPVNVEPLSDEHKARLEATDARIAAGESAPEGQGAIEGEEDQ